MIHDIAIDGPAASGKTVVGRLLAQRLDWWFLDTGIMYRAVTWLALERRRVSRTTPTRLGRAGPEVSHPLEVEAVSSEDVSEAG